MLQFGLIGAGVLGKAHAESLAHMPQAKLAAVADIDSKASQALCERWAKDAAVLDSQSLLDSTGIDAVIIATPTPFHYQQAIHALSAGKHVYLEIPMTRTLQDSESLAEAAQHSGRILTVGHTLRAYHEYETIRRKVGEGAIGKPGNIRLGRRTPHPRRWYSNPESSGSVVLDSMIHEFDFLRWCFGPVRRVFCQSLQGRMNVDTLDYALASLRLENGAIAHVESSWCHYGQYHLDAEVAGDKGFIQYSNQDTIPLMVSFIDPKESLRQYFSESPVIKPAHYKILEEFIAAIEGRGSNPIPPEEGLQALRIALAALESVRTHKPVAIP